MKYALLLTREANIPRPPFSMLVLARNVSTQ